MKQCQLRMGSAQRNERQFGNFIVVDQAPS
jgi:hypothetical protein